MTLKNGNLKDVIQIAITGGMLLVAATLAFGNKADRDKVSACEMKITTLESASSYNEKEHVAMMETLNKFSAKQDAILEKVGMIEARTRRIDR